MSSAPDVVHDVTDPNAWGAAIDEAVNAVRRGGLVVLPTDTVYGVGAEAFDADAVAAIGTAKGRADGTPPPVLVPDLRTLDGLATDVSADARALAAAFWPGALTLVLRAQPSLQWDLGDSRGVVALRVPDHPAALALLRRTGPLAVTGAQRAGQPAPRDAAAAREQLGDAVAVYLDGGAVPGGGSTVVDATVTPPRLVRAGAIDLARLREVVPALADAEASAPGAAPPADVAAAAPGPTASAATEGDG
ncbi:L-threonylcarbamoyladenylate synthase [Xylanimonas protaetiae]|uniref:L-threonylcarbamoyladenylate synthase n=1 Tax=Xylanimonas protaetiae TaxID=2509457 RepID=A0A4P6EZE0_9MICO|nr:L-threonylcarbamoyladenylate synthase [Xylanimonas protaetiae]QAY68820.1 threonylcarbamoyl-AMP synthase [Xylanimonas protaetiae]